MDPHFDPNWHQWLQNLIHMGGNGSSEDYNEVEAEAC